jgi:glycosyltransferase involved in cell wall biosynthesis
VNWIVSQLSAREHYAYVRALQHRDANVSLCTELWFGPVLRRLFPSVRHRGADDLAGVDVQQFALRYILQQAKGRLAGLQGWDSIEYLNREYDRWVAGVLKTMTGSAGKPGFLFCYSYTALESFKAVESAGYKKILGQIDPGPFEMKLVQQLHKDRQLPPLKVPSEQYWQRWREECQHADMILVNSEWSREGLVSEGVAGSKIEVVPLVLAQPVTPIQPADSAQLRDDDALTVLFLGQLIARKGIYETLEAIAQCQDAQVNWLFVGAAEPSVAAQLASIENVLYQAHVPPSQTYRYYQRADVFLLPTHSDGFALTQLEAVSHQLPIIASANCGRVAEHMKTGIILEEVSGQAIANAVQMLASDRSLLSDFRANMTMHRKWTIPGLSDSLGAIEQQLLGESA